MLDFDMLMPSDVMDSAGMFLEDPMPPQGQWGQNQGYEDYNHPGSHGAGYQHHAADGSSSAAWGQQGQGQGQTSAQT